MKRSTVAALLILYLTARSLLQNVEENATREIRQRIGGGDVQVHIRGEFPFGFLDGHLTRVQVNASHFSVDGLPFTLEDQYARNGKIDRFILDLRDATLAGLTAERVYVNVPNVRYDRGIALSKKVFRLTDTGVGKCEMVVTEDALADYIEYKYRPYVKDVQVKITPEKTIVSGKALVLVGEFDFRAEGQLVPRDGVYLDLADAKITFVGRDVPNETVRVIAQWLNPIIDAVKDLKVSDALRIAQLKLETGRMIGRGTAKVPIPLEEYLKQGR